jgi:hypothetical protein
VGTFPIIGKAKRCSEPNCTRGQHETGWMATLTSHHNADAKGNPIEAFAASLRGPKDSENKTVWANTPCNVQDCAGTRTAYLCTPVPGEAPLLIIFEHQDRADGTRMDLRNNRMPHPVSFPAELGGCFFLKVYYRF